MSTFWKTLLLSAAAAGVAAAGYAWLHRDELASKYMDSTFSSLLKEDGEFTDEEIDALMEELASQL